VIQFDLANQMNPITGRLYDLAPVNEVGETVANVTLSPARVICSLDIEPRTDVTQVSVLAKVLGNPPDGYFFEGYVTSPTTIGLSGDPETIAAMQGVVSTLPVNLSSHTENYTVEVPLDLPDGVTIVPENQLIHVTVFISPTANSRRYENIPVEIDGLDPTLYRATVMPEQVSVLIVGPEALLPEPADIQALVDLSGLGPGTHQVNAQGVITQENVDGSEMTITIEPVQLTVTIESLATPSRSDE
jgi:YbbR domain-containing protein